MIALSRWPTIIVGPVPPDSVPFHIYILDHSNISKDIAEYASLHGVDLKRSYEKDEILAGRSNGSIAALFLLMQPATQRSVRRQRGLLNRLTERLKRDCNEGVVCVLHIESAAFKIIVLQTFFASLYEFSRFKKSEQPVKDIYITSGRDPELALKIDEIAKISRWVFFVQDIVNTPPACKKPSDVALTIRNQLDDSNNVSISEWRGEELAIHFNPVWFVGAGSPHEPLLLRVEYKPDNAINPKPIVLVGKGVCFDAGGMNAKTDSTLAEMKLDIAGAAVAVAVLGYAVQSNWPIHLITYIPLVENIQGQHGMRTSDVVTIPMPSDPDHPTESIEVNDTDAEGRLLLCSAAAHSRHSDNPEMIMTIATLCGSTESMLGPYAAAAISRTKKLLDDMQSAGRITNENYATVWMSEDMLDECTDDCRGEITDWRNCNPTVSGGDTLAAFALVQNFAGPIALLHLDICGTSLFKWDITYKSKKRRPSGATGWGVRSVIEFFRRRYNLNETHN